jgi:hypothetical protein
MAESQVVAIIATKSALSCPPEEVGSHESKALFPYIPVMTTPGHLTRVRGQSALLKAGVALDG